MLSTVSSSPVELAGSPEGVLQPLEALDDVIHQKVRLGILSMLLVVGSADFKLLKEQLALSDGNLSTHLTVLEERGFIRVTKEFKGKKPHTLAEPTEEGRRAFAEYLKALERILHAATEAEA